MSIILPMQDVHRDRSTAVVSPSSHISPSHFITPRSSPSSSTSSTTSMVGQSSNVSNSASPSSTPPITPNVLSRALGDMKINDDGMMENKHHHAMIHNGMVHQSHGLHHPHQGGDEMDGDMDGHEESDDESPAAMAAAQAAAENSTHLFIGDLSRTATEDQLRAVFGSQGIVTHVDIKRDKFTTNNLGYGFVAFRTRDEATMAKKALNGVEIAGRKIRIGWAQKNTTLFIGDLDGTITTQQLQEVFRTFGPLIEDETYVKSPSGKFGFVRFQQRVDAERAKLEMNRKLLGSRAIRIGWGDNNVQKHCIHVQFNPTQGGHLNENHFRKHFERFGPVLSISLPRYPNRRLKGYGFVHFEDTMEGEKAANHAIESLAESKIGSVAIRCNFGKKQNYSRFQNRRNQFMMAAHAAAAAAAHAVTTPPGGTSPLTPGTIQCISYPPPPLPASPFRSSMIGTPSPHGLHTGWVMGLNPNGQWAPMPVSSAAHHVAAAAAHAVAQGFSSPTSPLSSATTSQSQSQSSQSNLPSLPNYYSPATRGRNLDPSLSLYPNVYGGYFPGSLQSNPSIQAAIVAAAAASTAANSSQHHHATSSQPNVNVGTPSNSVAQPPNSGNPTAVATAAYLHQQRQLAAVAAARYAAIAPQHQLYRGVDVNQLAAMQALAVAAASSSGSDHDSTSA